MIFSLPVGAWGAVTLETANHPDHLVVKNGDLFFSDISDIPVKKIDQDGRVVPLARKVGIPVGFCVQGEDIFWVETRSGWSEYCTGTGVIKVLNRTSGDGIRTLQLATGPNCAWGTQGMVVRGENVFWVTSTATPNTYRIEKVPLNGDLPAVVYTCEFDGISALTSDDTHLYWTETFYPDPGVIKRMPLEGGPATVVFENAYPLSGGLAVHDGYIFFADRGFPNSYRLLKIPVTGGAETFLAGRVITDLFAEKNWIRKLVADGEIVIWFDNDSINRTSVNGGPGTTLAGDLALTPVDIAIENGRVYWSETTGPSSSQTGSIRSVPVAGGAVRVEVQGGDAPFELEVDNGHLYWNEGGNIGTIEGFGRIARMDLSSGAIATVIGGVSSDCPPIAVDDSHVYIADGFRVKRVPVQGGTPEIIARGDFNIKGIAVDKGILYWTEDPMTAVRKMAVTGGQVMTLDVGSGPAGPVGAVDGDVYWMTNFDSIKKIPGEGGAVQTIASGLPFLNDFVVMGNELFFTEHDTGAIKKILLSDNTTSTLIMRSNMASPRFLALDNTFLYWIDQADVGKIPRGGGTPVIIAQGLNTDPYEGNSIAVDNSGVFWCETGSGEIRTSAYLTGSSGEYFPLAAGTSWTYKQEGQPDLTYTVQAQTELINGVQTRTILHSDGYRQYFTNDSNGIRLHRENDPDVYVEGAGLQQMTFTFTPPMIYAKSVMNLGETIQSTGTGRLTFSGLGTYDLTYEATSASEGFDTLDLPLGRFKAIRVRTTVRFYGIVAGQYFDETVTTVNWLTSGLGVVQWSDSDGSSTDMGRLSGTSIPVTDLSVYQGVMPWPIRVGEEFTYRVMAVNNGPDTATNVVLTDVLPQGLTFVSASTGCVEEAGIVVCDVGNLQPGGSFLSTITVIPTDWAPLVNRVTAYGVEADACMDDNSTSRLDQVIEDSDGDSIPDIIEIASCTDPNLADSDGDGLGDGVEDGNHNGIVNDGETDPCKWDSDEDGMSDGWEVQNQTDPMVKDDTADPDVDGFTNLDEFLSGTDPRDMGSIPLADINGDRRTTLADGILGLRILAQRNVDGSIRQDYVTSGTDLDGDGRAGMAEVIFILQTVSRMRQ